MSHSPGHLVMSVIIDDAVCAFVCLAFCVAFSLLYSGLSCKRDLIEIT